MELRDGQHAGARAERVVEEDVEPGDEVTITGFGGRAVTERAIAEAITKAQRPRALCRQLGRSGGGT